MSQALLPDACCVIAAFVGAYMLGPVRGGDMLRPVEFSLPSSRHLVNHPHDSKTQASSSFPPRVAESKLLKRRYHLRHSFLTRIRRGPSPKRPKRQRVRSISPYLLPVLP